MADIVNDSPYWDEKSETMSRPEIEEMQSSRLREIVKYAYDNSPYYRRTYDEAGVKPENIRGTEDLRKLPFIDKKTLRARINASEIYSDLLAVNKDDVRYIACSSGTTGQPTISPFNDEDFNNIVDVSARFFYENGMRKSDRYIHCLNLSMFVASPSVLAAQKIGAACMWGGIVPMDRLYNMLVKLKLTMILTTPSFAWNFGEYLQNKGVDFSEEISIRKLILAGEAGGSVPETRRKISNMWNADIGDIYGFSDIMGCLASSCGEHSGLHVAEDHVIVEVVDRATGQPVEDGVAGELVFTAIQKRARPMIRFRSGDMGKIVSRERCSCGRTHLRINVCGRADDMFIVRGVNIYPCDIDSLMKTINGISNEYRVHLFKKGVSTLYKMEVEKGQGNPEPDDILAKRITSKMKAVLMAKPADVTVVPYNSLERSEQKSKRVVVDY